MKGSPKKKDDEDDDVQLQGSEDEDESLESPPLVELLKANFRRLIHLLQTSIPNFEIPNSYDSTKTVPLGNIRLKVVEMI